VNHSNNFVKIIQLSHKKIYFKTFSIAECDY